MNEMSSQPDFNFKILLLGNAAVGKTSLVQRFVHDRFDSSYLMTIGMEPSEKHVKLKDGTHVALSIWDLAGQERLRFIRHTFYKQVTYQQYLHKQRQERYQQQQI